MRGKHLNLLLIIRDDDIIKHSTYPFGSLSLCSQPGTPPRRAPAASWQGPWLQPEVDALTRFLLPIDDYFAKDENGQDAFDRFASTEVSKNPSLALLFYIQTEARTAVASSLFFPKDTRRSGKACCHQYRRKEWDYLGRLDVLRGGDGFGNLKSRRESKGKRR